jgi:hypothetical protein
MSELSTFIIVVFLYLIVSFFANKLMFKIKTKWFLALVITVYSIFTYYYVVFPNILLLAYGIDLRIRQIPLLFIICFTIADANVVYVLCKRYIN